MQRKVLGKGLSALMPDISTKAGAKATNLSISQIRLSRFQPREKTNAQKMEELVASIKEKGVIQPVLVRPKEGGYELIAGERRLQAVKKLGFTQLPAIIKDVDDDEALQLSLIENIQREELNSIEEAKAYQRLINEFGYTQERIAKVIGKGASSVSNTLRLLKLPEEIQDALRGGLISMGHARSILAIEGLSEQDSVFKRTLAGHLSVREVENIVAKKQKTKKGKRHFKMKDPHIVAIEEQLQQILGTKVRVITGRKRGRLVLEYYSEDHLESLIKLLKSIK